jgi:hypothetical protein
MMYHWVADKDYSTEVCKAGKKASNIVIIAPQSANSLRSVQHDSRATMVHQTWPKKIAADPYDNSNLWQP